MSPCQCGCGEDAGTWPETHLARGRIKGRPRRYVRGHNGRRPWPDDDVLVAMAERLGSREAVGRELGCAGAVLGRYLARRPELAVRVAPFVYSHDPAGRAERKKLRLRQWRAARPELVRRLRRMHEANRRARMLGAWIENVDAETVFEIHGGRCGICGEFIEGDFHVDHVIPLARGGRHGYINAQPAHPRCNMRKGARDAHART